DARARVPQDRRPGTLDRAFPRATAFREPRLRAGLPALRLQLPLQGLEAATTEPSFGAPRSARPCRPCRCRSSETEAWHASATAGTANRPAYVWSGSWRLLLG